VRELIRSGALHHLFPATFPSGQGSDLAGVVAELGPEVASFTVGDEVIGFSMRRSSQAEYVIVPANQFDTAAVQGAVEVARFAVCRGVTAYAAVRAVHLVPGDTVVIAGAAGGVGSIAVSARPTQRCHGPRDRRAVQRCLANWPLARSGQTMETICRPDYWPQQSPDTLTHYWISSVGGYVAMAIEDLRLPPEKVDTIADFDAG